MIKIATNGRGYWSTVIADVKCLRMTLHAFEHTDQHAFVRVHFDPTSWPVEDNGLIYSDRGWIVNFRNHLMTLGFTQEEVAKLDYSEQGMQGGVGGSDPDYVHFDAYGPFISGWKRIFKGESVVL